MEGKRWDRARGPWAALCAAGWGALFGLCVLWAWLSELWQLGWFARDYYFSEDWED